jgi:hypothetical protein
MNFGISFLRLQHIYAMPLLSEGLASEQSFSDLTIEPNVTARLTQAAKAFHIGKLTLSANLFLSSYRILHSEFERNCYALQESSPSQAIRQNKERMLLSFISLNDFAKACSRNNEAYKDEAGKFKLEICAPQNGWSALSIAENICIKEDDKIKNWQQGKSIAHLLPLYDPIGRLLKEASTFKEAAITVSRICSFQVACVSNLFRKQEDGYKFIIDSMLWVRPRLSAETELMKAMNFNSSKFTKIQEQKKDNLDEEDDNTRTLLAPKVKLETKGTPLGKKEVEEISSLIDQFEITPHNGINFRQLREQRERDESDSSSDEEKRDSSSDEEKIRKHEESLVGLLDKFHITRAGSKANSRREAEWDSDSTL